MKIITTLLLLLSLTALNAQGLQLDPDAYAKAERTPKKLGRKFGTTSYQHSLKKYCPVPESQGKLPSCVGYATGYSALTISHAIQNNITDAQANSNKAFSSLFVYNQLEKPDCKSGTNFEDAFQLLQDKGNYFYADFDKPDRLDCERAPTSGELQTAQKYTIETSLSLFEVHETADNKILMTRNILESDYPVIVGMKVGQGLREATDWWQPSLTAHEGHAMVIIGYDDQKLSPHHDEDGKPIRGAFEVMNSHGPNWGNGGFTWISYKDYAETVSEAYYFKISKVQADDTNKRAIKLSGDFQFKSVSTFGDEMFTPENAQFQEKHYELENRIWPKLSKFQLFTDNLSAGEYLYVFSVGPDNAAYIHWPENTDLDDYGRFGAKESALIPNNRAEIAIPNESQALQKYAEGNDYLYILFSDKPYETPDLKTKMEQLSKYNGDNIDGFYQVFAEDLIPASDIDYSKTNMSLRVNAKTTGFVAPIVLRVGSE